MPIAALFGDQAEGPEDELFLHEPGVKVVSLRGGTLQWTDVRSLYRQRLPAGEQSVRVVTRMGAQEVTQAHLFPVAKRGEVLWVRAGELSKGDFLVTPSRLPHLDQGVAVSDALVELLSWQIAEGHERPDRNRVAITQKDRSVLEHLQRLYQEVMPDDGSGHINRGGAGKCDSLVICSEAYRGLLEGMGHVWGKLSAEKSLPAFVFALGDRQLALFLSSFFEAEGHTGRCGVELSSASLEVAQQLQYLLARFGIRAALHSKMACATNGSRVKRRYYRLHLSGHSLQLFHESIGFLSDRKKSACEKVASKKRNPNTGVPVGDVLSRLSELGLTCRALGLPSRQAAYETLSRESLETLLSRVRYLLTEEALEEYRQKSSKLGGTARMYSSRTHSALLNSRQELEDAASRIEFLCQPHLSYERVQSIEPGEFGGFVYDIEVDSDVWGDKNYVAGPVLLQHNTVSAIAAFEKLKGEGKATRALVIAPAGLRDNFLNKGVNRFTSSKGVILTNPSQVDGQVNEEVEYVIVSYAAFRLRPQEWLDKVKPDMLIADEFHRASNPDSKTYKSIAMAREQVPRFMGLTASIAQNEPADVVPLLTLATGGKQKIEDKGEFNRRYVKKTPSKRKGIMGGRTYEKTLQRRAELNARLGASIHYVEDLDASKKPTKETTDVQVTMSGEQLRQYRLSMKGVDPVILKKIKEGQEISQREAMNVFMKLMRARQVSNSLHLATPNMTLEQAAEQTPKIKRILDDAVAHIKDTPDAQVIMYTNMVHGGVDVVAAGLQARGIKFGMFVGKGVEGVTEETRQAAVNKYLAGENKVIIITGAGAEGLSLGNTTMVQLVDGHYNPERMAQAEARGIRAGGLSHREQKDRQVQVRRYVSALPKSFWQTITFRHADRSVGQYVYLTAERKAKLTRQLRDILKNRSDHETKKRDSALYRWFGGGP